MSSNNEHNRKRLLFTSYHCCIDPSSGAAISARVLLTLLGENGWDVHTFCGPLLDFDHGEDVRQILADEGIGCRERVGEFEGERFSLLSFRDGSIRSAVFLPHWLHQRSPSLRQGQLFLGGLASAIEESRPRIVLTYGGFWLAPRTLERARHSGARTAFWLCNFAYRNARLFAAIIRLWDDAEFYRQSSHQCRQRAESWQVELLLPQYEKVLGELLE